MKPKDTWPLILYAADIEEALGVSQTDAAAILRTVTVIDPSKQRRRAVTKKNLIEYVEGGN